MIPDWQTNFLYLADTLPDRYPEFFQRLEILLNNHNVAYSFLKSTKDIWAVDYMPIQIDIDKYVRFTYNPRYLQSKKYIETISDTDAICDSIGISTIKTNIILDGGNIIHSKDKVILTDRVLRDNPNLSIVEVVRELAVLFQTDDIFLIPEQPYEFTGHADGLVRFLDEKSIIVNDFGNNESKKFLKALEAAIKKIDTDVVSIPYNPYKNAHPDQARGCYINYLQMENLIVVPVFGIEEDEKALGRFEELFPGQEVVPLHSNEIADQGGILNCITWNIKLKNGVE